MKMERERSWSGPRYVALQRHGCLDAHAQDCGGDEPGISITDATRMNISMQVGYSVSFTRERETGTRLPFRRQCVLDTYSHREYPGFLECLVVQRVIVPLALWQGPNSGVLPCLQTRGESPLQYSKSYRRKSFPYLLGFNVHRIKDSFWYDLDRCAVQSSNS